MAFELPQLPYAYDALEPHIDARTMEIHHSKHHNGYTNNLNNAIAGTDLEGKSIEDILTGLDMNNGAVRNNGGGLLVRLKHLKTPLVKPLQRVLVLVGHGYVFKKVER